MVLNYPEHKVVLHCSMLVAGGVSRFTIHGDKASVVKARIDQQEAQLLAGVIPGSESWGEDSDAMVLLNAEVKPALSLRQRRPAAVLYKRARCPERQD